MQTAKPPPTQKTKTSQNIPAEVLSLDDVRKLFAHVTDVDFHGLLLEIGTIKRDVFKQFLKNGVQAARADIFRGLVHARGERRDLLDRVLGEGKLDALRVQQRLILLNQRIFRFF